MGDRGTASSTTTAKHGWGRGTRKHADSKAHQCGEWLLAPLGGVMPLEGSTISQRVAGAARCIQPKKTKSRPGKRRWDHKQPHKAPGERLGDLVLSLILLSKSYAPKSTPGRRYGARILSSPLKYLHRNLLPLSSSFQPRHCSPRNAIELISFSYQPLSVGSTLLWRFPPFSDMETRVPVQHPYSLRPASSFIGESLHDLNTVETRNGEIDGVSDAVTEVSIDNDNESTSADCIHDSYRNTLQPLHGVGAEEEHSTLDNDGRPSTPTYNILTMNDVSPIETVRARFLQFIVDHFVKENVVEMTDTSDTDYGHGHDKHKRKLREVHYQGDQRFVLPLMYVANLYETLVHDVNARLSSLVGIREKTIGVALEAAGGLYRKLAKNFPRKGPCSFKRRELATSLETRTRFPEIVVQDEKRVRFVVVNGLMILENPDNMSPEDAEWFKRLTGRHEVSISARDYKFYSPRHKYRRVQSNSISNISLPFSGPDNSCTLTNVSSFRHLSEHLDHLRAILFIFSATVHFFDGIEPLRDQLSLLSSDSINTFQSINDFFSRSTTSAFWSASMDSFLHMSDSINVSWPVKQFLHWSTII
ncbi:hypothetical protein KSP40_PGU010329 [Platanthera guangdongensis]|uniref:Uncharacterized protein n=1 Tax=Platanthera guangdongensis TaxID=2320717 RepID=A0ABR2LXF5_9ASPA